MGKRDTRTIHVCMGRWGCDIEIAYNTSNEMAATCSLSVVSISKSCRNQWTLKCTISNCVSMHF